MQSSSGLSISGPRPGAPHSEVLRASAVLPRNQGGWVLVALAQRTQEAWPFLDLASQPPPSAPGSRPSLLPQTQDPGPMPLSPLDPQSCSPASSFYLFFPL
jgi:hypothetical protein